MENNRDIIKSEFKYYLANIARSARRTSDGFNLGKTAVDSFLSFLEVNRLFDYNQERWSHIESMYDITNPKEVKLIADELLNDKEFIKHDNEKNQGWRSGAISHYVCFTNARSFFRNQKNISYKKNNSRQYPLQQIYYGAPGTGKSHKIKELTEGKQVIRTTFHPDSDYSTFVGAYKPTTMEVPMRDVTGKVIVENGEPVTENRIVYEFVEQTFLQAYIKAWRQFTKASAEGKDAEEVYLVIEEINRGNCAQIFGDLFQLLDRGENGFSEYPIDADMDLKKHLDKAFEGLYFNVPAIGGMTAEKTGAKLRSGEILLLPKNLYIWATMNTSDQSLFPIDSAFKRRWDWKYIKIKEGKDENGNRLDWKVDVKMDESGTLLPWWDFIKKINEIIASMTSSADKQLGYFFCCAKDGVIDKETFVSKVIFYLWNDVFKDYGFEDASLFRYNTKDENGRDTEKDLTFPDFYDEDGEEVNTERLTDFVKKVMSWKVDNKMDED